MQGEKSNVHQYFNRQSLCMNGGNTDVLNAAIQVVVISAAIYFFSFVTADPDLWGHIKFGEDIWFSGSLPDTDSYSFTAYNQPWINHEWLCELLFYLTYHLFKDAGLLIGKLIIGLCLTVYLCKVCRFRKQTPIIYAFVLVLAIFVISPGFMIRPQIFSFLFFTLFVYLIHLQLIFNKNYLYLLPIIMVAWVNIHGGFLMGWVFLLIVATWETLRRWVSGHNKEQLKVFWIWTVVTSLTILINPYGYKLLVFLFKSLTLNRDITEWRPVNLFDLSFLRFKIFVCLFLITLSLRLKKSNAWEVLAILAVLYASLRHQRHTPFFAIICAPYLSHHLSSGFESLRRKMNTPTLTKSARNSLAILISLVAIYHFYHTSSLYAKTKFRITVNLKEYPAAAVHFMHLNQIQGNVVLPFNWGEYVIWKLYPNCRVSIDGRFRTVYKESVIRAHFIHPDDVAKWWKLIHRYPADILLARQSTKWNKYIQANTKWKYVYSDKTAIVFLRKNAKNESLIKKFATTGLKYPTSEILPYFP